MNKFRQREHGRCLADQSLRSVAQPLFDTRYVIGGLEMLRKAFDAEFVCRRKVAGLDVGAERGDGFRGRRSRGAVETRFFYPASRL